MNHTNGGNTMVAGPTRTESITLQSLIGAAERLDRRKGKSEVDWLARVNPTLDRLAQPFTARPMRAFRKVVNGKDRLLCRSDPDDQLIEEALLPILSQVVERQSVDAVHGFRAGRSTWTAAAAASRLFAAGVVHVALADIHDFFPSVDWRLLADRVRRCLPAPLYEIVMALVTAPVIVDNVRTERAQGLALGRAISPGLANLYLAGVDEVMVRTNCGYLRYADDLLVAGKEPGSLTRGLDYLRRALAAVGLKLSESKLTVYAYDGRPIEYLGHAVNDKGVFERVRAERLVDITNRSPATTADPRDTPPTLNRRFRTLYVAETGVYLRVAQGMVQIRRGDQTLDEVPIHRIDRVLVIGAAAFSTGFASACIARAIPVFFIGGRNGGYGCLVSGSGANPLRARAQYDLLGRRERRLALAREVLDAKMLAMDRKIARRHTPPPPGVREQLATARRNLAAAQDFDSLRGFEGAATRAYYQAMATWIQVPEFAFHERSKRPPRDPINGLLSFTYTLLLNEVQTALLAHGLDPHLGLVHELGQNHPALASDLAEPYRSLIADSFVVSIVNHKQVTAAGFNQRTEGGVYMKPDTLREFLKSYEAMMTRPAGPKGVGSPRLLIDQAAHSMLRVVLGETDSLTLPLTCVIDSDEEQHVPYIDGRRV